MGSMDSMVVNSVETLGLAELDRQHRVLVEAIDGLREGVRDPGSDVSAWIQVIEVVRDHFAWEEAEMRREGFPDLVSHRRDHSRQLRTLEDHRVRMEREGIPEPGAVSALVAWNERHIRSRDREFAQFLQDPETWWARRELASWEDDRFLSRVG